MEKLLLNTLKSLTGQFGIVIFILGIFTNKVGFYPLEFRGSGLVIGTILFLIGMAIQYYAIKNAEKRKAKSPFEDEDVENYKIR